MPAAFSRVLIFAVALMGPLLARRAAAQTSTWPALERSAAPCDARDGAKDAGLIVAIEDYDTLPDITGARANAQAWYAYLRDAVHVRPDRISVLLDRDAQEYKILDQAGERAAQIAPGGRLWVVFIGHGAPAPSNTRGSVADGYLVSVSAEATAAGLEHRSVRRSTLLKELSRAHGEVVVVLDACFSGQAGDGQKLAGGLMPLAVVDRAVPAQVSVFTAAQGDELAGALPGALRPAFSYLLLGALRGWGDADKDGVITSAEALRYTQEALVAALRGERKQHPTLDGSSMALVRGMESGPALAASDPFATPRANEVASQRSAAVPSARADSWKNGMALLADGTFRMGSVSFEASQAAERPAHSVTVSSFYIDLHEVTVQEYKRCVDAGRCALPAQGSGYNWGANGKGDHPINGVTWGEAADYCAWANKRLPTEAEWEYAARGDRGRTYAWGESAPSAFRTTSSAVRPTTASAPVCSTPGGNTPEGVCDLTGNVWEWVADWYGPYPPGHRTDPRGIQIGQERVTRGTGFREQDPSDLRAANRKGLTPETRASDLGFRCAHAY